MDDCNPYESPRVAPVPQTGPKLVLDLGRLLMLSSLLIISFRFLAMPLMIALALRLPRRSLHAFHALTLCGLVLALLSPVDLGAPLLGRIHGQPHHGIRLVPVVQGMPAHTMLVAKHGEYISTGCAGLPCIYQPTYWIVWW
jgi:hypothetical protein